MDTWSRRRQRSRRNRFCGEAVTAVSQHHGSIPSPHMISEPITVPSSVFLATISDLPYFLTNSDLLKKFLFLGPSNCSSRRDEVIPARLRISLTRLNYFFLYLGLSPPSCLYCNTDDLTVQYLFSCPALKNNRHHFSVSPSLASSLSNKELFPVHIFLQTHLIHNLP